MEGLLALRIFIRVIERGSFSAVAREMGLSQPTISKQIRKLEQSLGTALLTRSTRHVVPTQEGLSYYQACRKAIAALDEAENQLNAGAERLSGVLRVAAPAAFGRLEILPYLAGFLDRHPALNVEVQLSDDIVDLLQSGIDVAFRFGQLLPEGAIARPLARLPSRLFASASYLAARGCPQSPGELAEHACITYQNASGRQRFWTLQRQDQVSSFLVNGQLSCNSSEGLRAAVLADMGICFAQPWLFREELEAGSVRPVLPAYHLPIMPLHVVYQADRRGNARVMALVAYLEQCWREQGTLPPLSAE